MAPPLPLLLLLFLFLFLFLLPLLLLLLLSLLLLLHTHRSLQGALVLVGQPPHPLMPMTLWLMSSLLMASLFAVPLVTQRGL